MNTIKEQNLWCTDMKKLLNRRNFIKGSIAGSAVAAIYKPKPAKAMSFEGYPEAMGVLVDLSRCVGCRSCEAA